MPHHGPDQVLRERERGQGRSGRLLVTARNVLPRADSIFLMLTMMRRDFFLSCRAGQPFHVRSLHGGTPPSYQI
jgi:hypothetical protein